MAMEVTSDKAICFRCGKAYGRYKGNFPVSYAELHKGIGYCPVCKECVDSIYDKYLSKCENARSAVRQTCRKLDIFWDDHLYDLVEKKSSPRSAMTQYIAKTTSTTNAGKCYDDTLSKEGTLWTFKPTPQNQIEQQTNTVYNDTTYTDTFIIKEEACPPPTDDVIAYWGKGYSNSMYAELEQRRAYYTSRIDTGDNLDIGSEILIRQICNLEVNIAKDSAAGRSIDKSINAVNTLLGSLNLKPTQKKNEEMEAEMSDTPLGVWLYRYENKRPLPEVDKQLEDTNHIKKYIFTWMGHLCKMLNIKNGYTKMYEEEISRLRVEKPEYDGDDEELMYDTYSESEPESKPFE